MKENNLSLFFEYTSPRNQIVIPYQKEEYTLIGARHNDIEETRILRLDLEQFRSTPWLISRSHGIRS